MIGLRERREGLVHAGKGRGREREQQSSSEWYCHGFGSCFGV